MRFDRRKVTIVHAKPVNGDTPVDPAKNAINVAKHGIPLARYADLDVMAFVADERTKYGEPRFRAWG